MNRVYFGLFMAAVAVSSVVFCGCKSEDDFRRERAENAMKHFERSRYRHPDEGKTFTLRDCIVLAQKNNLELKVQELEAQVAREQKTADMLGMLPELNIKNILTGRTNVAASGSEKTVADGASYGYSTSADRNINVFSTEVAMSTLDFGLAFFSTVQANDRALMREQRLRRTSQNLTLDVVKAYFKVAAAQRAIRISDKLLKDCREYTQLIKKLVEAKRLDPFVAFDKSRQFFDMEKRLTAFTRNYRNSCIELRAMLGMDPSGTINVDDSILNQVPKMEFPSLELLEQIALLERPELYEADIRKHINVVNCRKEIVKMIPSARLFMDFNNNNNSYLYHASWYSIGVNAAYNLLKLPQHIANYAAYSSMAEAEAVKAYSLGVGIMAQVRISHFDMVSARERYQIEDRIYNTYRKKLNSAVALLRTSQDMSKLELNHMKLETAEREIARLIALGNMYVSYFQVLNSLGVSKIDTDSLDVIKNELAAARLRAESELAQAESRYNDSLINSSTVEKKSKKEVQKPAAISNQPLTILGSSEHVSAGI